MGAAERRKIYKACLFRQTHGRGLHVHNCILLVQWRGKYPRPRLEGVAIFLEQVGSRPKNSTDGFLDPRICES